MNTRRKKFIAVLCCIAVILSLSCCGSSDSEKSSYSGSASAVNSAAAVAESDSRDLSYASEEISGDSAPSEAAVSEGGGSSVYRNQDAKLIRRAELTIRTDEFDKSKAALEAMVEEVGGYFQDASFYNDDYRQVNSSRMGEYLIRVPAENYDSFMKRSGELGYISEQSESTEDIGEQYHDTEVRLKTQQTKQQRLLELLAQAENMEDIIALENALTEVEYQIDQMTSTLNHYDSLVGFSTIRLLLMEEGRVTPETGTNNSLFERMGAAFSESISDIADGIQDFLVWLSYNFIGLVLFIIIVVVCVIVIRRLYLRRIKKKLTNTSLNNPQFEDSDVSQEVIEAADSEIAGEGNTPPADNKDNGEESITLIEEKNDDE